MKTDGPFRTGRQWYSQFYAKADEAATIRTEVNGKYYTKGLTTPADAGHAIDDGLPF